MTLAVRADIERTVEKSFGVRPGGTLRVETHGADINVVQSTDPVVKVVARERIRASTEAKADRLLAGLTMAIEQRGNEVTAFAKYGRAILGVPMGSRSAVTVEFVVTAPAGTTLVLHTAEGKIVVGDFTGDVTVRTTAGDIVLGKIDGEVDARTTGGSIALDEGRRVVKLVAGGGNISVGRAVGPAQFSTTGGDIGVAAVESSIQATAKGGNVRVVISGQLNSDSKLKASGGSIKVDCDRRLAFRLDASAGGGRVDAPALNLTGQKTNRSHSWLKGTVNEGGPLLTLQASGDDIVVWTW